MNEPAWVGKPLWVFRRLISTELYAMRLHRFAHRLLEAGWNEVAATLWVTGRVLFGVDIHPAAVIGERLTLPHGGNGVVIGPAAVIGDDVMVMQQVTIGTPRVGITENPVIGDRVTIASGAKVLGGISVGADAVVGANAVVVKDVPPGAHVAGVPSRIVGWAEGCGP